MRWHPEAVAFSCKKAIKVLQALPFIKDFYLAGGTALAIQLGHRISVDLDFFSAKNSLGFIEREALKRFFKKASNFKIREESEGTLHIDLQETAISFLHYSYPLIKPLRIWEGLTLASMEDIGLMKIGAIIGRGAKKDFIDLYTLCRKTPLLEFFKMADKKFPDSGDFVMQAARALVYFADSEKDPLPRLLAPVSWADIKKYFEEETPKTIKIFLSR